MELYINLRIIQRESFNQLVTVETLELYINQLTMLPASFGQVVVFGGLESMHHPAGPADGVLWPARGICRPWGFPNQLTMPPESFGQLVDLQTLELYRDPLPALPGFFGQLVT